MSYKRSEFPESFYVLLNRIMNRIKTAVQETTGKVPIGLLVTKPKDFSDQVGILTEKGFDSLSFMNGKNTQTSPKEDYHELTIRKECFIEGEICLETNTCFCSNEKTPQKFYYANEENILLSDQSLAELLTQIEGIILLQGYISYGYLVADAGPDEEVRRLWSLIHSVENEYYNTTGGEDCIYLDVLENPLSLTPVYMVGDPDPIPLVLKDEWDIAVVHAEADYLEVVE